MQSLSPFPADGITHPASCSFENSFLGICTWFEARGKGVNKAIPPALVDKGCKHGKKKSEILQE